MTVSPTAKSAAVGLFEVRRVLPDLLGGEHAVAVEPDADVLPVELRHVLKGAQPEAIRAI